MDLEICVCTCACSCVCMQVYLSVCRYVCKILIKKRGHEFERRDLGRFERGRRDDVNIVVLMY